MGRVRGSTSVVGSGHGEQPRYPERRRRRAAIALALIIAFVVGLALALGTDRRDPADRDLPVRAVSAGRIRSDRPGADRGSHRWAAVGPEAAANLWHSGYPGPGASPTAPPWPTTTPTPLPGGRFAAPGVPLAPFGWAELLAVPGLRRVVQAVEELHPEVLRAMTHGSSIPILGPGATEGWGASLSTASLGATLETALGGSPAVQGAFAPGCVPRRPTCEVFLVISGLEGPLPVATTAPPRIGPPAPSSAPLGAAAWHLLPDEPGAVWWRAWIAGDGYHRLVDRLATDGLGPYVPAR